MILVVCKGEGGRAKAKGSKGLGLRLIPIKIKAVHVTSRSVFG
jgi:hypothetical protein